MVGVVFGLLLLVLLIASGWVIFAKAGEPGWAALVPIYNGIVLLRICDKPAWWVILLLIFPISIVMGIILAFELAKSFGKEAGFAIGMILLPFVFYPMLAFGDAEYLGPGGSIRRKSRRSISRFNDEDDEDDDRPRSRSRVRDEVDDRPSRKRRDDDDEDEDDRPRRRK